MQGLQLELQAGFVLHDDVATFYAGDARRERSPEVDFGVWWTLPGETWPNWRVSWVEATGEVYAVAQTQGDLGPVVSRAGFPTREGVEAALEGWADHCHQGGLRWLWERLASRSAA